jgi:hypothetical protein
MKLLYPEFLWALAALSIPIIIHLFNFRKFTKVYFSNIELLKEVKLETKSKSRLKHLLILLIRLLLVSFLVFAFAQPYIPVEKEKQHGDTTVAVYIDNSHSMDTKGENGYLLDLAKEQAILIAESYKATDRFQVITNDLEARHQRLVSKDEFIGLVEEVEPSYVARGLDQIYLRQSDALLEREGNKTLYWLSDFQKNNIQLDEVKNDSSLEIFLLPYKQQGKGNVYIDSIWFETPIRKTASEENIFARVVNKTGYPIEFKIELAINSAIQGFGNFTIAENSLTNCIVPFAVAQNGMQHCKLYLTEYPEPDMLFDDEYFFSYSIEKKVSVLQLVEKENANDTLGYLSNLFNSNDLFRFTAKSLSNLDFSTLNQYDFIITKGLSEISTGLSSELISYTNQGGSLLVFPSSTINLDTYKNFLQTLAGGNLLAIDTGSTKVSYLNVEHPIYKDVFDKIPENVDLPKVNEYYPISFANSSGTEYLMKLENGNSFLSSTKVNKGNFYFCSTPLASKASNFPKHALFVASLLRIGEFSQPSSTLSYTIGKDNTIAFQEIASDVKKLTIKSTSEEMEFIPEIRKVKNETSLLVYDQIRASGHYNITYDANVIGGFSFNYDRSESDFSFYTTKELYELLAKSPIGNQARIIEGADGASSINVNELVQGKQYWWQCIMLVLILLGLEIVVTRLWK